MRAERVLLGWEKTPIQSKGTQNKLVNDRGNIPVEETSEAKYLENQGKGERETLVLGLGSER